MINRPGRRRISVVTGILAVPVGAALLWLLLSPARVEQWTPHTVAGGLGLLRSLGLDLTFGQLEVLANLAVFFPVGALSFVLLRQRVRWLSMLIGPLLSLAAETAQALWLPERVASVQDWALNSTGSWLGVGAAWLIAAMVPRRPAAAHGLPADDAQGGSGVTAP